MFPNLSKIVLNFSQDIQFFIVYEEIHNHKKESFFEEKTIRATVQQQNFNFSIKNNLDTSKTYSTIHTNEIIKLNDEFEHNGVRYKIVNVGNFLDYGYVECIGEEVR